MEEPGDIPPSQGAEVRKFLARGLLFLALVVSVFLALNARMAAQITELDELIFAEMLSPKIRANTIILGSSHSACGINPRYLEDEQHSVYNFSFHGADPIYYERWYPYFERDYVQPRIILFQADWFVTRETPYLFRHLDQDSDLLPASDFRKLVLSTPLKGQRELWLNRFVLFQNRQKIERLFVPARGSHCVPLDQAYHGFCPAVCPTTPPGKIVAESVPERRAALVRLTREWLERGITVIWVQTPEFLSARAIDPEYQEEIAALARELGVPLLNYNTDRSSEFNSEPTNFCDWAHLNPKGADLFSQSLAEDLSKLPEWEAR